MAKRNARSRKQKPRRARRADKKIAKRTAARKTSRSARKAHPAHRAPPRRAKTGTVRKTGSVRPKPAALSRPRRVLPDEKLVIPSAPSTLGYSPKASSAESGHKKYHQHARQHASEDTRLTGGDVDVDWNEAYSSGEESPGGDTPTPDQDVVEEIGRALGVEYDDAEELKGSDKIVERDRHRWEYDPASAEDYRDRNKKD